MKTKPFWESKALWSAVIIGIAGLLNLWGYNEYAELLLTVGVAGGIIGLRLANKKIQ